MCELIFFTTAGCHLCDKAKALVAGSLEPSWRLHTVDIACDEQLIERYGLRIPVLRSAAGEELDWPFDEKDLADFVRCVSS